jgi:hypothetical protein
MTVLRLDLLLVFLGAAPALTGCTTSLDMRAFEDPKVPTSTVYYTGVRSGARRFPDYGSIDRTILQVRRP